MDGLRASAGLLRRGRLRRRRQQQPHSGSVLALPLRPRKIRRQLRRSVSSRMAALRAQTLQSEDSEDSRVESTVGEPGDPLAGGAAALSDATGREPHGQLGPVELLEASPASRSLQTPRALVEAQTPAARLVEAQTPAARLVEAHTPAARLVEAHTPPARLVEASALPARLVETSALLCSTQHLAAVPPSVAPAMLSGPQGESTGEELPWDSPLQRILAELNRIPSSRRRAARLFEWLISPMPPDHFYRRLWEREAVLVRRQDHSYYQGLFSTAVLDSILRNEEVQFGQHLDAARYINGRRETLNPPGRALPAAAWSLYRAGCSLQGQAVVSLKQIFHIQMQRCRHRAALFYMPFHGQYIYGKNTVTQQFHIIQPGFFQYFAAGHCQQVAFAVCVTTCPGPGVVYIVINHQHLCAL